MNDLLQRIMETDINKPLTLERTLISFGISLVMALVILFVYRFTHRGAVFPRSFALSLMLVALVTTFVILPISSNLVLSLGMVGALSIVRFRTALKDPLDIVYMFWSIALGLTTGSGFYALAIGGCLFIGVVLIVARLLPPSSHRAYLLVVHHTDVFKGDLRKYLGGPYTIRSRTSTAQGVELIVGFTLKGENLTWARALESEPGILSVSIVERTGG